ncbi:MAG: hypothetical protein GY841_12285 [FCB group bacterium]|nr:hypothetical protein [FCB group bacterium]
MANPVIVATPAGEWTKIVTGSKNADIYVMSGSPTQYIQTIRDTGETAPDAADKLAEGVTMDEFTRLDSAVERDVYIWCVGSDGIVRVDA